MLCNTDCVCGRQHEFGVGVYGLALYITRYVFMPLPPIPSLFVVLVDSQYLAATNKNTTEKQYAKHKSARTRYAIFTVCGWFVFVASVYTEELPLARVHAQRTWRPLPSSAGVDWCRLLKQGGATVISSFLRGNGDEPHAESGGRKQDGLLVDRVVITIAPVFLQGYNVLATKTSDADQSSTHDTGLCWSPEK